MTDNVQPVKRRFELVPFDKIERKKDRNYLVKDLIPREGLVVVWGPPKCGKTFWILDLVMHVALDWKYRGRKVTKGTVVYIACEGERGLAARVTAFRQERMGDLTNHPNFYLLTPRLDLADDHAMLIGDIRAQLGDDVPVVVVVDTLNRSLGGSESSDEDMGAYIKAADAIREAFGCAIVIVHHCGLEDRRPRGHTSLAGAADAQIAVKRESDGSFVATVEFMKDGTEGAEIRSTLPQVVVGTDEDGDTVTSCIVEAAEGDGTASRRRTHKPVTGATKVALDALRKALDDAGEPAPPDNHIAGHLRVVRLDLWRRYAYAGSVSDSDKPDTKLKAFARSVTKLQAAGMVGVWTEWAWLIN